MATAQIVKDFIGFGAISKSLGRPPKPYCSVKLKPIGSIGQDETVIVYGDEATPDFTDAIDVLFGDAQPETWDSLQAGYSYVWNVGRKILTIKDAAGNLQSSRKITAWCDLAVTAEVLESHQFTYVIDGSYTPDAFFIATRQMSMRNSCMMLVQWGEFERTLDMGFHIAYVRLQNWLTKDDAAGSDSYLCAGGVETLRNFICALMRDLSQSAIFSQNLQIAPEDVRGKTIKADKTAMVTAIGKYLMIYTLSSSLLLSDKYCYEPWMLWQMFKWLQRTAHVEVEDKIFDLSPNWGA